MRDRERETEGGRRRQADRDRQARTEKERWTHWVIAQGLDNLGNVEQQHILKKHREYIYQGV